MNEKEIKAHACTVARAILTADGGYVDRVTELWALGNALYGEAWDTEFHVFGVVASDIDHLPIHAVREHYSKRGLAAADEELMRITDSYRSDVEQACNTILSKHAGT